MGNSVGECVYIVVVKVGKVDFGCGNSSHTADDDMVFHVFGCLQ
jgi:hypothetical protein